MEICSAHQTTKQLASFLFSIAFKIKRHGNIYEGTGNNANGGASQTTNRQLNAQFSLFCVYTVQ